MKSSSIICGLIAAGLLSGCSMFSETEEPKIIEEPAGWRQSVQPQPEPSPSPGPTPTEPN